MKLYVKWSTGQTTIRQFKDRLEAMKWLNAEKFDCCMYGISAVDVVEEYDFYGEDKDDE